MIPGIWNIHESQWVGGYQLDDEANHDLQEQTGVHENYNTPLEHTPGNPLANYERNPFIACW